MSVLGLVILLIVVGVLMWLVNAKIPMDDTIKMILNVVVVIIVVLFVLEVFGVLDAVRGVRVPRVN